MNLKSISNNEALHKFPIMGDYDIINDNTWNSFKESFDSDFILTRFEEVEKSIVLGLEFLIKKDSELVAIVGTFAPEIQSVEYVKKRFATYIKQYESKYGILTDGNAYYIYYRINSDISDNVVKTYKISDIEDLLFKKITIGQIAISPIKNYLTSIGFQSFVDGVCFANDKCLFENKNFEDKFWETILEENGNKVSKLCKYTTLDTLYALLTRGTYRVSGLVGMNDKSELDFFDDYCGTTDDTNVNDVFISCGVEDCDDLTMWRLYGDNAKGVCLVFEVKDIAKDTFMLHKVSYAIKTKDGGYNNQKLDIIKSLMTLGLHFGEKNKWKHFFKASEYSIEKEIRLLYINNELCQRDVSWVRTIDHSILNPTIDFNLRKEAFPLKLVKIVLGNNCPEIEINRKQIKDMLKIIGFSDVEIVSSNIKNYR